MVKKYEENELVKVYRKLVGLILICALIFLLAFMSVAVGGREKVIWLEAERFDDTGGWSNDSQFVDLMGSPYLLATGVGKPVDDAVTQANIKQGGKYRLWVRCKDWLADHSPGRFGVKVAGKESAVVFGKADTDEWQWVDGGLFELEAGEVEVRLCDKTGWWGRCDAVVLASGDFQPADAKRALARQRVKYLGVSEAINDMGSYDVVVVGGGLAGCAAAVSSARHGCRVAFIQDRPVLGGNSSSEIQVPVMGHCTWKDFNKYEPGVTGLIEEFYPVVGSTGRSEEMEAIVRGEGNISLYLNTRATGVENESEEKIKSVLALNVKTGERLRFSAPLFIDCTGHGWLGYWAGAEYRQGQEARSEFGESLAPLKAGERTMGNDLYHAEFREREEPVPFECPEWAYHWTKPDDFEPRDSHPESDDLKRPENFDPPARGKGRQPRPDDIYGGTYHSWWVEYGGMKDTVCDAEEIRDELFRINIGLWDYAKNHNPMTKQKNRNREMVWLNYVAGVRESRRLIGDYIMTQRDYDEQIVQKDTVAFTDWGIDVHQPEGFWVKSVDVIHTYKNRRASIPYRCLYSKNIGNLFMAGRCISVSHIALGGTRIMRTVCITGQAVGTAASLCRRYEASPRGIYTKHIEELQQMLLKDGCYIIGVANRDPEDMALKAEVSASSSTENMAASNVNNGWNRVVGDKLNCWSPDPCSMFPDWIELRFSERTVVNNVHISFQKRQYRVIAFSVQAWAKDGWKTVARVEDNMSRRCVLNFEGVETDRIRLVISRAAEKCGICEIRVYNEQ